jgi:hypothetical protein
MRHPSAGGGDAGFVRADQIDLKSLDEQLEHHLGRPAERGGVAAAAAAQFLGTGSRGAEDQQTPLQRCREDWEIDLAKLIIKGVIARGTFGTVHRGVYDDGQDVAGIVHTILPLYNYLRAHSHWTTNFLVPTCTSC